MHRRCLARGSRAHVCVCGPSVLPGGHHARGGGSWPGGRPLPRLPPRPFPSEASCPAGVSSQAEDASCPRVKSASSRVSVPHSPVGSRARRPGRSGSFLRTEKAPRGRAWRCARSERLLVRARGGDSRKEAREASERSRRGGARAQTGPVREGAVARGSLGRRAPAAHGVPLAGAPGAASLPAASQSPPVGRESCRGCRASSPRSQPASLGILFLSYQHLNSGFHCIL